MRGVKHCLTANASAACRPDGNLLPPRPPPASVCAVGVSPCDRSPAQVWRLSAVGEIESNLTRDSDHGMCLDGGDGAVAVYTNWCVRDTKFKSGGWAQLWHWSTAGTAGAIVLAMPHTCAATNAENRLVLAACTAVSERAWTLPASAPLPPLPPPPPPPAPPPPPCASIKVQTNCTSTHGRCVWKTGHCVIPPAVPWPPPPPPREQHSVVCLGLLTPLACVTHSDLLYIASVLMDSIFAAVETPRWSATKPNSTTNATFGYPLLAPDKANHSYAYRASKTFGTYNHGPMITYNLGLYWMEWYNGVDTEGVENRVLYTTSEDAVAWSEVRV